ncbi:hypothetical protein CMU30_14005 [Elizabethkingia anophelis]|nr:hypothetical protein [Elizabethkingia anophelis]MDV3684393.1 hypothetical protein [Elizabethkingia anophelis]MDV3699736.1 hypothetical protein [Elizabethkingia anophelis]MDV3763610.1 hypothetical protein [Elizabethkingia anophelis]MDV3802654.1 hypothetical protein [Elizabethkingia anophelis]
MSDNNNSKNTGFGLASVLFIVFLILKLCKVIDWSWWWVTSPLWISVLIQVAILICAGIAFLFIKRKVEKQKEMHFSKFKHRMHDMHNRNL